MKNALFLAASVLTLAIAVGCSSSDSNSDNATAADKGISGTDAATVEDTAVVDDYVLPQYDLAMPDVPPVACDARPADPGRIGESCEQDCDCEAGLICYGEAYVAPHKICTRECQGGCGPESEYKCLIFSPKHKELHGITMMTICMPVCTTLSDCKAISDIYGHCPGKSAWTKWDDLTLAISTCQVQEM